MSEAIAEIGHNSGETELSQFEKYQIRSNELVAGVDRFSEKVKDGIQDDEMAEKAADFRLQLRGAINVFEKAREAEKKPHWDAGKKVDADYKSIKTPIEKAIGIIDIPLLAYSQKKEAERLAQLKAEREAQAKKEAEAKALADKALESQKLADKVAADKAIEQAKEASNVVEKREVKKTTFGKSPVNGRATGVRMTTVTTAKVTDSQKAAALFHSHPDVIAAIEKISTDLFKKDTGLQLEGVERITTDNLR